MSGTGSADRILTILDVFTENRLEWTAEELIEKLGYSRPTLYRYVKLLKEAGFLVSMPNGVWTLGPRFVEMDFLMQRSDPLVRRGTEHLLALSQAWPCTGFLVRWYGEKILCVASECSIPNPISSYPRGRPMPLARGAISRTIMANLPRRHIEKLVLTNLEELKSIGLGNDATQIIETLKGVRREGVAVGFGEVTKGVIGIASPVFGESRTPIAALCMTIAETEVDSDAIMKIKKHIKAAAQKLSESLEEYPNMEARENALPEFG